MVEHQSHSEPELGVAHQFTIITPPFSFSSKGLPPKCSHIAVDLAMACNICISAIRVWLISGDCMFSEINHIYRVAIERGYYDIYSD